MKKFVKGILGVAGLGFIAAGVVSLWECLTELEEWRNGERVYYPKNSDFDDDTNDDFTLFDNDSADDAGWADGASDDFEDDNSMSGADCLDVLSGAVK